MFPVAVGSGVLVEGGDAPITAAAAAFAAVVGGPCPSHAHDRGVNQDGAGHCWKFGSRSAPIDGESVIPGRGLVPAAICVATYLHPAVQLTHLVPYGLKKLPDGHTGSPI